VLGRETYAIRDQLIRIDLYFPTYDWFEGVAPLPMLKGASHAPLRCPIPQVHCSAKPAVQWNCQHMGYIV
jgi:hypothetical protein